MIDLFIQERHVSNTGGIMNIDLGFSPCPNDTFIFHALLHGLVDTAGITFRPHIYDVEELNRRAFSGTYDVTKLSFHAWLLLRDRYALLNSGAALGHGCGPLVVARDVKTDLAGARIAIPGEYTTAYLLLRLWMPEATRVEAVRFDRIMPGVRDGLYDAGLIIHEGRFVYPQYDLVSLVDLGEWWERKTSMPIPLGCIAVKQECPVAVRETINAILRSSVEFAMGSRDASRDYIRLHAQELDDRVVDEHIQLYVNDFTLDLGDGGHAAIRVLEDMARTSGIIGRGVA